MTSHSPKILQGARVNLRTPVMFGPSPQLERSPEDSSQRCRYSVGWDEEDSSREGDGAEDGGTSDVRRTDGERVGVSVAYFPAGHTPTGVEARFGAGHARAFGAACGDPDRV